MKRGTGMKRSEKRFDVWRGRRASAYRIVDGSTRAKLTTGRPWTGLRVQEKEQDRQRSMDGMKAEPTGAEIRDVAGSVRQASRRIF